jgi:hypothetical protein
MPGIRQHQFEMMAADEFLLVDNKLTVEHRFR